MSDYFIKPNRQKCPKCGGIISVRQDHYGKYLVCYICGKNIHPRDLPHNIHQQLLEAKSANDPTSARARN